MSPEVTFSLQDWRKGGLTESSVGSHVVKGSGEGLEVAGKKIGSGRLDGQGKKEGRLPRHEKLGLSLQQPAISN